MFETMLYDFFNLMSVVYVDDFSSIFSHATESGTFSLHKAMESESFFAISPTKITLYRSYFHYKLISEFSLPDLQNGFFLDMVVLPNNKISVLLSIGILFNFSINDGIFFFDSITKLENNVSICCITSIENMIITGNENGSISVISESISTFKCADEPIKKININQQHCVLMTANGFSYFFPNNPSIFQNNTTKSIEANFLTEEPIKTFSLSDSDFVAISKPNFQCEVINLKTHEITLLKTKMNNSSSIFWHDSYTLFIFFSDGKIIVWNYFHQIQRIFRFSELKNCNYGITTNFFSIVSCDIGIVLLPLIHISYSEFPLLYGINFILELRMTKEGPIRIKHEITSSHVHSVVADENEKFLAVLTDDRVLFIDRNSSNILTPEISRNISYITFCGDNLCVVEHDSFYFVNVNDFTCSPKHQIPNVPINLFSDSYSCGFIFTDYILVCKINEPIVKIPIHEKIIRCIIHSQTNQLLVFYESRKLELINYKEKDKDTILITNNVSDFFFDPNFDLIFVIKGTKVKLCSLKNFKLFSYSETTDYVIGIIPSCSSILSYQQNNKKINVNYFFDLSIVSELQNPDLAAKTVLPMRNTKFFPNLIRQISVFALREKMGKNCVTFLSYFPEIFKYCITNALRSVESPERQEVFQMIGLPSKIFINFLGLKIEQNKSGIPIFKEKSTTTNNKDLQYSSILLPVIMEEEGPNIAFPASFYILKKMHNDIETIESLFRFLDPLIGPSEMKDKDTVDCSGMLLKYNDYCELKIRLNNLIEFCLCDYVFNFQLNLFCPFCVASKTNVYKFLEKFVNVDSKFKLDVVVSNIRNLVKDKVMSKEDLVVTVNVFRKGNWKNWSLAMYITLEDKQNVLSIINDDPNLFQIVHEKYNDFLDKC